MNIQEMKEQVLKTIDSRRDVYLKLGEEIYKNPETGYKEFKTTKTLSKALKNLGFEVKDNIAYTGCRAYTNQEKQGPKIVVMGELDSVVCPAHTDSDRETGAMHACGHNIQTTVMYGVADALKNSGVLELLDGKIDFMAVPAEEYIELDYRENLRKENKIKYFAGKPELIYRGAFDDVDMCMMVHNFPISKDGFKFASYNTGNGFIGKTTKFIGKQSHAGAAPWEGINALNIATVAMECMALQRETFKEEDTVRLHQIITKGGDIVNCVPDDVRLETTVRASNIKALKEVNEKVNTCIKGAAIALGGHAEIKDSPGQMPLKSDKNLAKLSIKEALNFYKESEIMECMKSTASFDMGDLSLLMPVFHGITSGIEGGLHSKDYKIVSEEDAYITPIKIMTLMVIDLLANKCEEANRIIKEFKPEMTKEEYLKYLDSIENTYNF